MRPGYWHPLIELNAREQSIVKRIKRAKLFTFLRECRHQLFNDEFQEELNKLYADASKGKPPVPPDPLALVTILQAYTGASDAEAIEALIMDRRWQFALDCLDCEQAPFSQATLVRFRSALIIQGLDRRSSNTCLLMSNKKNKIVRDTAPAMTIFLSSGKKITIIPEEKKAASNKYLITFKVEAILRSLTAATSSGKR